ncbi:sulfite exporter TauE/SafE family protein [Tepidibacter thalassicus]|uniref:Sulfite exporter TauE/SafE n=1 Tax=Tepidibacter thalassicus DSM 15285 TaxID=1123350 RepID=A0A1M5RKR8_9FIRM|nr:sulfite exporter TauE/SafE family protein [Tepidibacter thalassicus]SHH26790.1 Sulfite exporter TauE/SafE [Tepidibacter thalassicus DSM 15285]
MTKVLLGIIILSGIPFALMLFKAYFKRKAEGKLEKESFIQIGLIGAFANFFDTLGLSSFAIETSLFKNFKLVDDAKLPGTLNVGATIPTLFQACIFIASIKVEPLTLFSMIIAALIGAIVGAGLISKLPKKTIQLAMGIALLTMAVILIADQLKLLPVGGNAMELSGSKLIIAIIGNFIFGALNTLGIGLFAPCMTLVYMLGMAPIAAFPIMMGSCALLLPFAGMKFIKEDAHSAKASMAINTMGPIGVLIAAFLVKKMDIHLLKLLLIFIVLYTTVMMFKSYKENVSISNKNIA